MSKKQFWQLFLINLLILFCTYSSMLFMHFSIDSYGLYFDINENMALVAGRLIFYIFYMFCELTGFNPVKEQLFLIIAFIILSAYVLTGLFDLLIKCIPEKIKEMYLLFEITLLIGFINVFYFEWFLWPEVTLIYGLAMVFLFLAIKTTVKITTMKGTEVFFSIIFLFLSLNCYQSTFPIYIMFTVVIFLLKYNLKFSYKLLKKILRVLSIAGIAAALQVIELKILQLFSFVRSDFLNSEQPVQIFMNIQEIFLQQLPLWQSAFGFLPKGTLLIVLIVIVVLFCKGANISKLKLQDIIFDFVMLLGCYSSIFVLGLLNEIVWLAPRTIVGFFFFLSVLLICAIYLFRFDKKIINLLHVMGIFFLILNFIQIQNISVNHFVSQALDQQQIDEVQKNIEEYENITGIKIENVAVRNDLNPTWRHSNVNYTRFETNTRVLITPWAAVPCLNYYTGNHYNQVEFPDEIYFQFGKECDWSELNLGEQMIFINQTAYLVSY